MKQQFKFKAGDLIVEKGGRRKARIVGGYSGEDGDFYKVFWLDGQNLAQFKLWNRETIETFYDLEERG